MVEAKKGTARLISAQVSEEVLKADLENYRQKALQFGAAQAEVVPAQWVEVDERVRLKCYISRCVSYGRCAYCPPHTPEPEFMRKALSRFNWAVLFRKDVVPVEDFATYSRDGAKHGRKTMEIIGKIETLAFADGHYLAVGFGAGSCWDALCGDLVCQVLDSGRCRHPYRARPSMEAVGIDVFGLAAKVGWDMYPIYNGVDPKVVPCASTVGIIFVH